MKEPILIELPTFFGMKTVNSFLFKDPVPTLIDCGEGTPEVWAALKRALKENGLEMKDIERVVITHAHVDHIGGAARLASECGATIWVSDLVYDWALNRKHNWEKRGKIMMGTLSRFFDKNTFENILSLYHTMEKMIKKAWPPVPQSHLHLFDHEGIIELNGTEWQVLYMPGHSANQSCFFNPRNGHLLSADMLLKVTPTPVMDTCKNAPTQRDKTIFKLLDSYQKIRQYDIRKIFPGHYDIFENATETIDRQVERIHQRAEECYQLIANGTHSFPDLGKALYGNNLHLPAVNMIIGYLDLLEAQNRIFFEKNEVGTLLIFAN
ncbi:MAG TPA: MBL fold metallo-hydrolase [Bacteroidetes bacterium]|nr:MBL fold metallo-hydrolase [Bacteroidota bacterium]